MSEPTSTGPTAGRPLDGLRVIDLSRLAPGPYATMLLADLGADVIVVGGGAGSGPIPALARGKRFCTLDLKTEAGREALLGLAGASDVLVEGFRPGVMDRLGLGWERLRARNPRLVCCALTGYGQAGPLAQEAGHDLNYVGLSGALGAFGPRDGEPAFPLNLLADFAGGSLFAVIGILSALQRRGRTGQGGFVDSSMVDGCLSLMAMHFPDWGRPVLAGRGDGLLAGSAPFYRCYRCRDGRHVAVAALEPRFFGHLWAGLGYPGPPPDHLDREAWPAMAERFAATFAGRSRDAWVELFAGRDACLSPVLDPDEALAHPHNRARHPGLARERVPVVPRLAGAETEAAATDLADRTREILEPLGLWRAELQPPPAREGGDSTGLRWPPL